MNAALTMKALNSLSRALKACLRRGAEIVSQRQPTPDNGQGATRKPLKFEALQNKPLESDLPNPPPDRIEFRRLRSQLSMNLL